MSTYILQKDLPDVKAGVEGVVNEAGLLCFYENKSTGTPEYFFPKDAYENNPEWFKLKEEVDINNAKDLLLDNGYTLFKDGKGEAKTKFTRIDISDTLPRFLKTLYYKYSEEDMRNCFDAARQYVNNNNKISFCGGERFVYLIFEDYKNKL